MTKVFITGATGFVGKNLIKKLVEKTDITDFFILVRDKERAESLLKEETKKAEKLSKKIIFFQGDIIIKGVGLTNEQLDLVKEIDEVYHLASDISLSNEEKDKNRIFNTNLNGTKNILEIFKESDKLKNFYYFSSAYGCGKTNKKVNEGWFNETYSFRNHYEKSKYLSEELFKEYSNKYSIPVIILRPSIISASSEADFPSLKNQTFYYYGRILKKAVELQNLPKTIRLIGKNNSTSNIIPLKDLINIVIEIRNSDNKKKFYNLVNPVNISTNSYLDAIRQKTNFEKDFVFIEELNYDNLSEEEKFIYNRTKPYFEYNLIENLEWESENTKEMKEKLNIKDLDNSWIKDHIMQFFSFLENERQ